MGIESSAGASREILPAATYTLQAAGMLWQSRSASGMTLSCASLPAVSRLPLYRSGLANDTSSHLRREQREKEK